MKELKKQNQEKIKQSAETATYDFSLLQEKDNINGVSKFLIDSLAVAIVLKQHDDPAQYIDWFNEWCEQLLKLWPKNTRNQLQD